MQERFSDPWVFWSGNLRKVPVTPHINVHTTNCGTRDCFISPSLANTAAGISRSAHSHSFTLLYSILGATASFQNQKHKLTHPNATVVVDPLHKQHKLMIQCISPLSQAMFGAQNHPKAMHPVPVGFRKRSVRRWKASCTSGSLTSWCQKLPVKEAWETWLMLTATRILQFSLQSSFDGRSSNCLRVFSTSSSETGF